MFRYRIQYAKLDALRYTSNLDMHRIWERALRRAKVPLAYSQGFHPQPKLNQACPLPLGIISRVELIDVWLEEELETNILSTLLTPALPSGIQIFSIQLINQKESSLPTQIQSADYHVEFLTPINPHQLAAQVAELLEQINLPRTWRNKHYDLRPLILALNILPSGSVSATLSMTLSAREGATGRPEEVVSALGYEPFLVRIERVGLSLNQPEG